MVAAAWHDAGYGGAYQEHGFATEEAYAAHLATSHLTRQGAETADITLVHEAILATQLHAGRRALYGLALHRADIDNLGGPYDKFLDANTRLWHEAAVLGAPLSWEEHQSQTEKFITFTVAEAKQDLPRLAEHVGTPHAFDTVATQNLECYLMETTPITTVK